MNNKIPPRVPARWFSSPSPRMSATDFAPCRLTLWLTTSLLGDACNPSPWADRQNGYVACWWPVPGQDRKFRCPLRVTAGALVPLDDVQRSSKASEVEPAAKHVLDWTADLNALFQTSPPPETCYTGKIQS